MSEILDEAKQLTPIQIPVSRGIPNYVKLLFLFTIVGIMLLLGLVAGTSGINHVWPSENSAKIKL